MHGTAHGQNALSLANYDFDGMVKYYENGEALRRNQILQQFANGETREQYRRSDMTTEQLEAEAEKLRKEAVEDALKGKRLSKDVDTDSDSKITQSDIEQLCSIGRKSISDFTHEDIQKSEKWAKKFYSELGAKSPFFRAWFGDWRANDTSTTNITTVSDISAYEAMESMPTGTFINKDSDWSIVAGTVGRNDTVSHSGREKISVKMLSEIQKIIENAVLLDTEVSEKNSSKKHNETLFMHKLYAPVDFNGDLYVAKVTVEEYGTGDSSRRFYNLRGIKIDPVGGAPDARTSYDTMPDTRSTYSISDLYSLVKSNDKDFKENPASAVVNKDGTPKVMYHGTSSFGFTVFDYDHQKFGLFGVGSYFTDDIDVATSYTEKGKGDNKGVYAVYLNIKNPLDMDENANVSVWNQYVPDAEGYFDNCQTNEDCFKALKEYCADEYMSKYEAEEYIQDVIRGMGYDGITHIGGGRFNKQDATRHRVYIAFDSEQIKSATDNIGTFDEGNPDIRYSKDIFTQEEREKIISEGYTDYLKRQFVVTDKSGGYAKAISMTERRKLAQQIAQPLKGVNVQDALAAITPVFKTLRKEAVEDALKGKRLSKDVDTDSDSKITQSDIEQLCSIGRKSISDFTHEDIQKSEKWAKKFYSELGAKSPFFRAWFGDWRANDTSTTNITTVSDISAYEAMESMPTGTFINKDSDWSIVAGTVGRNDTVSHSGREKISVKMLSEIQKIIENAVLLDTEVSEKNSSKKHNETLFMHKLYAPVDFNGDLYVAKVTVEEYGTGDSSRRFYNLRGIKIDPVGGAPDARTSYDTMPDTRSTYSISDLYSLVKSNDKDFKENPASAVVNKDGTPKVMYHGTSSFGFTVFDYDHQKFGLFGVGSYFTDDIDVATSYTEKGKGDNKGVYAVYLNIKNPLDMDENANVSVWNQYVPDAEGYFDNCQTNEDCFKALKEYCADEYMSKYEAEEYIQDVIRGMGYDGITHIGGGRFNKQDATRHRVYIAFDSEQIKSATDNIGTFDEGNPDIRYSKDIFTQEEREKIISEGYTDYLKRLGWRKIFVLTYKGKDSCSPSLPLYAFGA